MAPLGTDSRWGFCRGVRSKPTSVCRPDAGCANHPGYFGRSDRSRLGKLGCAPRSVERREGVVVILLLVTGEDAGDAAERHLQEGVLGEVGIAGVGPRRGGPR